MLQLCHRNTTVLLLLTCPWSESVQSQHKKPDAGSYKAFKEDRKHDNGKLTPEQTTNGTDFSDIQA